MRRIILLSVLVTEALIAMCGNPVMLIRCRSFEQPLTLSGVTTAMMSSAMVTDIDCFDGEIDIDMSPFICEQQNIRQDTIRLTIRKSNGDPFNAEEGLTLDDIQNCIFVDNPDTISYPLGTLDTAGFSIPTGMTADSIVIEFIRDPYSPTVLSFTDQGDFTIPACPRASDPCNCGPDNIIDADGNVLFWADELTYIGNPDSTITLLNLSSDGFMVDSMTPYPDGTLGMTDANGVLSVPFFRRFGETTDIQLTEGVGGAMTQFMFVCTKAADACIERIPTVGEWGITLLILMMLIVSIASIRQRDTDRSRSII